MPTIKDVAEKAGVTVTTVSRVLNNRGYISAKTRERVYQVMEEINYRPNEIARSLLRQKSNIIGLIIPSVAHPFFGELSSHLEYYAYDQGYKILLCDSNFDAVKEQDYVEMLRSRKVDGLIMGSHSIDVSAFLKDELPVVSFDRRIGDHIPYVASDSLFGGHLAAGLLARKGCKKVAHLSGNSRLNLLANRRNEGFLEEAHRNKMEAITIEAETDMFNPNKEQITKLFSSHTGLDGIFAGSDLQAAYIIQECNERKIRIPEDIKLIGYDDVTLASLLVPQLTTIRQPIGDMAKLAFELVKKQIAGEDFAVENTLDVTLIERKST